MNNLVDERIIALRQRWMALAGWTFNIALTIDLLVRALILKQHPRQYWDIGLIWLVTTVFVSIGMTRSGVAPFGETKWSWKRSGLAILIIAVEVPAVLTLMGMVHSVQEFVTDAVLSAVSAFIMLMIMRGIYSMWERRTLGPEPREE